MTEQKKALLDWLESPITERYFRHLQKHAQDLRERILFVSREAFKGTTVLTRSEDEISLHQRLIAVELVLNDLSPLFDFKKYCAETKIEIAECPDEYEAIVEGERETRPNPLTDFINNLYP